MDTATKLMKLANNKAKVAGTYHGIKFTGTAVSSRQITVSPYPEQITIQLDQPIEIYQRMAQRILISSDDIDKGKFDMSVNEYDPEDARQEAYEKKTGRCATCGRVLIECWCD